MALLDVHNLHFSYGSIAALSGISFAVEAGQIVSLIGVNSAGKTTTLNSISGLLRPIHGRVTFNEQDITGWRADKIAALGLGHVPETRQVIASMTVMQNLMMGAYRRSDSAAVYADIDAFFERFPSLEERRFQKAGSISTSEQNLLAIGCALMAKPSLLMLDEPSMGLDAPVVNEVFKLIADLKAEGTPILLAEQNARRALQVSDYAYILERGAIAHQGTASTLREDATIIAAYLG
jgi:branched-chain amino acid transport system ATP-binding protein